MRGDRVEASGGSREVHGVGEGDAGGEQHDHGDQRDYQPEKDDAHLLDVRPGDGLDAADHGVSDHHGAHEKGGAAFGPSQDDGEYDGGGVDREAGGDAALAEEDQAGQSAGFRVEALFE